MIPSRRHYILAVGILSVSILFSCSKHSRSPVTTSMDPATIDCTGFKSEMIIPYGLTIGNAKDFAGKKFAKLVAVDKGTGEMEITIQNPDGGNIPTDFIDIFADYTLRFIACRENISGITGGISTSRACSLLGSINLVGKEDVKSSDFVDNFYVVGDVKVHATTSPAFDSSKNFLRPNFIMLTAGLIDTNLLGEFMIAYGTSPYYNGCYPSKE
jgi:hypothetical protein